MHCLLKGWYTPRSGAASFGFRVYIAKITFTTLIDHFTSLYAVKHWFIVTNFVKLALSTQSIRQQKLPPHLRISAFDPAVRVALAHLRRGEGRSYLASDKLYPIETAYSNKFRSESQQPFRHSLEESCRRQGVALAKTNEIEYYIPEHGRMEIGRKGKQCT